MAPSSLSKRSQRTQLPVPEYKKLFLSQCISSSGVGMYHPTSNPEGLIPLSIAENRLSMDLVAARYARAKPPPVDYFGYGDPSADERLAATLATFLERHVTHRKVEQSDVVVTCGASGAIDQLLHHLCDAGEAALVVAPGYQGFEYCAGIRAGVRVVAAQLEAVNEYRVTADVFERAWQEAGGADSGVRAVILSSPGNPTGEVLQASTLLDIISWARERGLHVISDELYALSVFAEGSRFVSAMEVLDGQVGDDVHLIWAVSKDFCGSGMRLGAIVTQNAELRRALAHTTFFADVPRPAQWAVSDLLGDDAFVVNFIAENKRRLSAAYGKITAHLDAAGVPHVRAESGFFLIVDLRQFLDSAPSRESEMLLFRRLADAKVLVTPCCEAFSTTYGLFRVCYGAIDPADLDEAWERIRGVLFSSES